MPTQSLLLTNKLRSLGRTLLCAEFSRRLVTAISGSILLLAALVLADGLLELPLATRRSLLIIAGVIAGIFLGRALITPVTQSRDVEELALLSEKHHPDFDSRLISAVQFARGKATNAAEADALVGAMVADTETIAGKTDFLSAVDWRFLGRAMLALLGIACVATAAFFIWFGVTPTLVKRAFLADVAIPRDTRISKIVTSITDPAGETVTEEYDRNGILVTDPPGATPGITTRDLKVGIGDQITITATAAGKLPADGTLRVEFDSGRRLDYTLVKSADADGTYSAAIEDVPESFRYQIRLNDARSSDHEITALARPEVEALSASQIYPDYTGIEPSNHKPGDFYLFPGSKLTLNLVASKPLDEAQLRLIGLDEEIPFKQVGTEGTASFDVPTEGLTGFSITMSADGRQAREPAVYRAELLGDEPPQVRITYPTRSDELVTKSARSLIAFEATDRFGIATVSINFRTNESAPQSLELDIGESEKPPTSLKHQFDWELEKIEPPLKEGDILEYWISAQDLQKVAPGIGESEHLRLRVVSVGEKRQDLLSRASDYLGGVGATTEDQQRLNKDLGELIRAKAKQ